MIEEGRATSASLPARTVFFGSGTFGVPVLDALRTVPDARIVAVVTLPDRPAGRHATLTPTPVAAAAEAAGLPVLRLASVRTPEAIERIATFRPRLGVLADFGRIIPPPLLELPPRGILNVHPSVLPRHRGATPLAATILEGDSEAGVTIILMDDGLDTGPIVAQHAWHLRGDETAPEIAAEAGRAAADLIRRVVPAWLAGEVTAVRQSAAGATMTRPYRREDGRLDPSLPAVRLERAVRALQPWPGTFVVTRSGRLAVLEAAATTAQPGDEPGRLLPDGDGLALATVDGRLRLLRVVPSGGRSMSGAEYRRGAGREVVRSRIVEPDRSVPVPPRGPR